MAMKNKPNSFLNREKWQLQASEYYKHHMGCQVCVRAGISRNKKRCAEGRRLFDDYMEAVK